jgi:hypothetical protein
MFWSAEAIQPAHNAQTINQRPRRLIETAEMASVWSVSGPEPLTEHRGQGKFGPPHAMPFCHQELQFYF